MSARVRLALRAAACALALLAGGSGAHAQLAQRFQHEGRFNYVQAVSSMRTQSNASNPCAFTNSSSITISSIPAGATIAAAYLYWAGSGSPDNTVTFAGQRTSGTEYTGSYTSGGATLSFFGVRADVTSLISGNGTFTLTGLNVSTGGSYCSLEAVVKGWSLIVVYEHAAQPLRRVTVFDGLDVLHTASATLNLSGFMAAPAQSSRVSLLVWEGDATASGGEDLTFNGTSLDASGDVFNSESGHGVDLESVDVSSLITPGDRTANISYVTQNDLMVMQTAVTSMSIVTVDVTPKAGAVSSPPGTAYGQVFAVENTSLAIDNFNLRATRSGAPAFVQIDSITGAGISGGTAGDSVRATVPAQTTRSYTVWYTVPSGGTAVNALALTARSITYPGVPQAASSGSVDVTRAVASSPAITVFTTVSPNGTVQPGTVLTYEVVFTNTGTGPAVAVVVEDDLPTDVVFQLGSVTSSLPGGITAAVEYFDGAAWTYSPASGGCGAQAGYDAGVRAVRWVLGASLPAGASGTGWVSVRVR